MKKRAEDFAKALQGVEAALRRAVRQKKKPSVTVRLCCI